MDYKCDRCGLQFAHPILLNSHIQEKQCKPTIHETYSLGRMLLAFGIAIGIITTIGAVGVIAAYLGIQLSYSPDVIQQDRFRVLNVLLALIVMTLPFGLFGTVWSASYVHTHKSIIARAIGVGIFLSPLGIIAGLAITGIVVGNGTMGLLLGYVSWSLAAVMGMAGLSIT